MKTYVEESINIRIDSRILAMLFCRDVIKKEEVEEQFVTLKGICNNLVGNMAMGVCLRSSSGVGVTG